MLRVRLATKEMTWSPPGWVMLVALAVTLSGASVGGRVVLAATPPPAVAVATPTTWAPAPVPCLDLPISSAVIAPASCWQTGPTSIVAAGSRPGAPATGEVAVIDGQAQSLAVARGSGPLRVRSAGTGTACLKQSNGQLRAVSLTTGKLGPAGSACQPASTTLTPSLAAAQPATAAQQPAGGLPPAVTPSYYEDYAYLTGRPRALRMGRWACWARTGECSSGQPDA